MAAVILKARRERPLVRRHPWIFSGAVAEVIGGPQPGETVDVLSSAGGLLGRGAYSPESQIAVRIWSFDPDEEISAAFLRSRLDRAIDTRRRWYGAAREPSACRLVNAESDGLPGLIVDRYADFLVCQFLTAGAERWRDTFVELLSDLAPCAGIYERSDVDVRAKEGLPERAGTLAGREPPERVEIAEGLCRFLVDIRRGHKTGFYLDQRENRAVTAGLAEGAEVLNAFSYTGAFGIAALKGGAARVANIESSAEARALAAENAALNAIDADRIEDIDGDVFVELRRMRDSRRSFDLIILDPPKFADSRGHLERACRGYKDINVLAFKLVRRGGRVATFSCSGLLSPERFEEIVAAAAADAGRDSQIAAKLTQAPDHPSGLHFPEGAYLKGLVCTVW